MIIAWQLSCKQISLTSPALSRYKFKEKQEAGQMAKVKKNIFIRGLSGKLGDQFVIKTDKGGRTIVSAKPIFPSDREFSPAQLAHQQAFPEAVAYANLAKEKEIYRLKAIGGPKSAYNVALGDYFNPPEILTVDLSQWTRGNGGTVRAKVQDDVRVAQVKVTISDETGAVLEEGMAQEAGALCCAYSTTQAATNNLRVTISAKALPGHITEKTELK